MDILKIGFEVLENTNKHINTNASSKANNSRVIGIENGSLGVDPNAYTITTNSLQGIAVSVSYQGHAEATGIRNEGIIRISQKGGIVIGRGNSRTLKDGDSTIAVGINSTGDKSAILFDGNGTLLGHAVATGQDNIGAFGVITSSVNADIGVQKIIGSVKATGVTTPEARGVSIGVSDIDDDTLAGNPPGLAVTTSGVAEIGKVYLGAGNDLIQATSSVAVTAQDGDEIFFAGANGIVVDGGTITELEELLATIGKDLTNFTGNDIEQIIDQLDTSLLDMGSGNDKLIADVKINASQLGVGDDDDLEVIADAIENAGTLLLGAGVDSVDLKVSVFSTIQGAKALAQGIDNSSVGILTALKLGSTDHVLFDMGSGNDVVTSESTASAVGDLAAADALGNQAIFVAGLGNDTFNLLAESRLTLGIRNDEVEQQESIADGIENRGRFFLDDPNSPEGGDDVVIATATAFGEGLQTRAQGIESREFFDAGAGNDLFTLTATAVTGPSAFAENLTHAAGLQTEQKTSGTFLLGNGDDTIIARGSAIGSDNLKTLAFGVTQVTPDDTVPGDSGLFDAGDGNDTIEGIATTSGASNNQVEAHGLLFTNALGGAGDDRFVGTANATAGNLATANGIRIGVSNDNVMANGERLREPLLLDNGQNVIESGILDLGVGQNIVTGRGSATMTSDGTSTLFNDVNGILVDVQSILTSGDGDNTITGSAETIDQGVGGGAFDFRALNALSADGIEIRGELSLGNGVDIITGMATGEATNSFLVVDGIDIGLGSTQNGIPVLASVDLNGGDNQLIGIATASASGDEAAVITAGIQSVGIIIFGSDDDRIVAESTSTVIGGKDGVRGSRADGLQNGLEFGGSITPATIKMGAGNDSIEALATATSTDSDAFAAGISQVEGSVISMDDGDDIIIAKAFAVSPKASDAYGIFGGTINTVNGNDQIIATSNFGPMKGGFGLGGGVIVDMGAGDDILSGFGEASVDGGEGIDTLQFDFSWEDFGIAGGSMGIVEHGMSFSLGGITMVATNFEVFTFAGAIMPTQGLT